MARRLGSLFLTAALGPLQYAGQCIMARRVEDGLRQLSGEDVMGAFQRGIAAVAQEVGVGPADVASLLPMGEMAALAARLGEHQQRSIAEWHLHAGDTGLLDGVADLTIDGRAPDASLCLLRLSAKMKLDKQLAAPLRQLSEDVDVWQRNLEACRLSIEDGEALKRAYRQRRLIRIGLVVAGILAVTAVAVWITRVALARSRVDEALAAGDPCGVEISPADRAKASAEQEAALADQSKACEAQRAAARQKAEDERLRLEAERRAAALAAEKEARCEAIAAAAAGNGAVEAIEGEALVARVASRRLEAGDLEIATEDLPCSGTPAFPRLAGAYTQAALDSLAAWLYSAKPSEGAVSLFGAGKSQVSEDAKVNFAGHAEQYAKKALVTGNQENLARAKGLCRAAAALDQPARQYCRNVAGVP